MDPRSLEEAGEPIAPSTAGGGTGTARRIAELEAENRSLWTENDALREQVASSLQLGAGPLGPLRSLIGRARWLRHRLRPLGGARLGLLWHHPPRPLRIPTRYLAEEPPRPAPLVSIVTPSFNQAAFLERTLRSVASQGYPELEHIVQDGGSDDGSAEILSGWRARLTHLEIGPDGGQAAAINRGFEHASGDILAYLNSDDVLLPGAVSYVARYFDAHPEVDVVYGHRVLIDDADAEVGRWVLPEHQDEVLSWADYVPQETLFWRRGIWERSGATLDESFRFALDWDLLLRFRDAGACIVRLPRFLGAFRVHPEQKSSAQAETLGRSEMDRLRSRVHGRPVARYEVGRALRPFIWRHIVLDKAVRIGAIRH